MIRPLFAILLLIGAAACGEQQASRHLPAPAPALWEVTGSNGQRGWLFGTIHALPAGAAWTTPALDRVINEAGVLVVEVRDLDPERTGATFRKLAADEPVPPLVDRITPSARADLETILAEADIPARSYDRLETWAAALAIARTAKTSPTNGADVALIARFTGRPVEELEGAQKQLMIFDGLPEPDQRSLLNAVIAERNDPDADARELAGEWLTGDLAKLEKSTRRGLLADPALYRALSSERNRAWAGKLAEFITQRRRPLIAVGAAHMLGPEGLPNLLSQAGFEVRRIQ